MSRFFYITVVLIGFWLSAGPEKVPAQEPMNAPACIPHQESDRVFCAPLTLDECLHHPDRCYWW